MRHLVSIREVFERNQITPSIALEEIQKLAEEVEQFSNSVNELISSMSRFQIGAEELDPGECELGVLVPRASVDNNLDEFGRELSTLHRTFGVFEELITGSRTGFKIRTTSSTDLSGCRGVVATAIPFRGNASWWRGTSRTATSPKRAPYVTTTTTTPSHRGDTLSGRKQWRPLYYALSLSTNNK